MSLTQVRMCHGKTSKECDKGTICIYLRIGLDEESTDSGMPRVLAVLERRYERKRTVRCRDAVEEEF